MMRPVRGSRKPTAIEPVANLRQRMLRLVVGGVPIRLDDLMKEGDGGFPGGECGEHCRWGLAA
jgi:hypothetical protein